MDRQLAEEVTCFLKVQGVPSATKFTLGYAELGKQWNCQNQVIQIHFMTTWEALYVGAILPQF